MDLRTWLPILIYLVLGAGVAVALFSLSLVGRKRPNATKALPFESGILTTQPARQRFSIDFYLTAMLFIVFDIELAFLYPLAVVLRDVGVTAVIELVVFTTILVGALTYVWRKGALEWR
ncbi:MAG: NADH-quinone oxidoreductase subunit A [Actinomycetota bacterium]|jgi:NADH-quinone oxidoreductase subunit A|nr:NADH-quinone oxidoreductase subunit A [Actinomycetota bacterium]